MQWIIYRVLNPGSYPRLVGNEEPVHLIQWGWTYLGCNLHLPVTKKQFYLIISSTQPMLQIYLLKRETNSSQKTVLQVRYPTSFKKGMPS